MPPRWLLRGLVTSDVPEQLWPLYVLTCYVAPSLLSNWGKGGHISVNAGHLYFLVFYSGRLFSVFLYAVKFFVLYTNYCPLRNLEETDHLRDIGPHRGDTIKIYLNPFSSWRNSP